MERDLPRSPAKVWLTFLTDELRLDNKDGGLRLVLDSLMPRTQASTESEGTAETP